MRNKLLKTVEPAVFRAQSLITRLVKGTTLGVRVALFDGDRVLLVRHSYIAGWYFPGGGVDPGETAEEAAHRELFEETGLVAETPLRLHGVFFNARMAHRDHVLVYSADSWRRDRPFVANGEIREARFFSPSELPDDTSTATRARLAEIRDDVPASPRW